MPRTGRLTTAAALLAAISALATACTGRTADSATDDPKAQVTLSFWHGWSAPGEVAAIEDGIARFEKAHPNITVEVTGNMVMVSCRVVFGLGVGLLATRIKTGVGVFRTLFHLPYLAPPVAATLAFVFLLNPGTGPANTLLDAVGLPTPGWFTDADWSKPALTALALWGVGDLMVVFMAALLDVPKEQYEAAELDGAGAWARLRHITLPNISPIIMFAVVTGVIQAMQYYTQPLVAGKVASGVIGGSGQQFEPGYPDRSTLTLPQLVHNLGFQRFDYGAACVVALVLFALSMAFTALLMRRRGALIGAGR
ncbi:carbohydrate ABC transporter permease [Streptomyces sp. NRRL F-4474]|uniref:carbohydrate ABC transporter permease n=1 Tax=Streptomyces sp. NRRL F-4474 TaxID=1463851 RepID=UPI000AD48AC1|nr:sugar ABC transporter permease [Streptomyces sp. NRRL F-4474]